MPFLNVPFCVMFPLTSTQDLTKDVTVHGKTSLRTASPYGLFRDLLLMAREPAREVVSAMVLVDLSSASFSV